MWRIDGGIVGGRGVEDRWRDCRGKGVWRIGGGNVGGRGVEDRWRDCRGKGCGG